MRRHVGKGIQGACAPMAERWAGALLRRGGLREQRVEQSEISEHSEHSEGLADARSFSRCSALRKRRGAYGCHLPARGGPPTCAGLLLAWWGVGDAVDWHFLWDIVGAVCEGSAALEVFVDYVLRGVVHVFVIYRANRLFCLQR